MQPCRFILAVLANLVVSVSSAAYTSWGDARAGVVRDTLYIQGGTYGKLLPDEPGLFTFTGAGLAQFNFSTKFDGNSNFSDVFLNRPMNYTNPDAQPHVGGFMFVDYNEWYAFGGRADMSYKTTSNLTEIIRDALYIPNSAATAAPLGLTQTADYLPAGNGTNRYITNGAGVSAPSESLGFYFSGLHAPGNTEMNYFVSNRSSSTFPSVLADSMLMVDTQNFGASVWTELPLPPSVTPRADAVLSWVPVGARGVVIVIGGIPFPASLAQNCDVTGYPQAVNNSDAAEFMTNLSVYDVASQTWYSQETNGDVSPPPLAQACAVVATSGNVHNIYIYGGYSGNDGTSTSDDVWILSVPAFTWTKVSSSSPAHGRYSHVCAQPYPDQMMVVGGLSGCGVPLETPAFADVFNLSTLTWTGSYDPAVYGPYVIPTQVSNAIKASPTASMVAGLSSIFNTQYTSAQRSFYPYSTANSSNSNNEINKPHKSSLPTWAIAVIAVIAVLAIVAAGTTVWCCRRGNKGRSTSQSTRTGRRSIIAWVRGNPQPPLTVTSEDDMTQVDNTPHGHGVYEVDSYFKRRPQTQVAELTANDSQVNSPSLGSPFGSPRGPVSPSSPSSAELYTPPARYELPGNFVQNQNITSHPLFPHNISGDASTVHSPLSVSSPSTIPITPYELPRKRSDEDILPQPNDLDLNDSRASRSGLVSTHPKSPRIKAANVSGSVSPDFSAMSVSPDQGPTHLPTTTPPTQPINKLTNTNTKHTRNTSSLSSNLPDLQSPTPLEDQRRSVHIAALPDSPNPTTNPTTRRPLSSTAEATSDTDPNTAFPQRSGSGISPIVSPERKSQLDKQVRRKELQNWAPGRSAYHENEDMYGGKGDTV